MAELLIKADPRLISLRDLNETDIPQLMDYLFRAPTGYLESIGLDPKKLPPEAELTASVRENCRNNAEHPQSKINAVVIQYDGKAIGSHTINPLVEGDFGIFHAHIWNPEMRRKGIAIHSYRWACQLFMERFELKRILFKTPIQNLGSVRVKEKLGIRYLGEETIGFGIVTDGTLAKVFELTREEAKQLADRP